MWNIKSGYNWNGRYHKFDFNIREKSNCFYHEFNNSQMENFKKIFVSFKSVWSLGFPLKIINKNLLAPRNFYFDFILEKIFA
jgi:hypothetical protein